MLAPIPRTAAASDSAELTRNVAFAPIPAGGLSTSGKPTSSAKLSASDTAATSLFLATGSPDADSFAFINPLSRKSSATSGRVPGTSKRARASASCTMITSRMPTMRMMGPWRRRSTSMASWMSCPESGSVTRTTSWKMRAAFPFGAAVETPSRRTPSRAATARTKRIVVSVGYGATKTTLRGIDATFA